MEYYEYLSNPFSFSTVLHNNFKKIMHFEINLCLNSSHATFHQYSHRECVPQTMKDVRTDATREHHNDT